MHLQFCALQVKFPPMIIGTDGLSESSCWSCISAFIDHAASSYSILLLTSLMKIFSVVVVGSNYSAWL